MIKHQSRTLVLLLLLTSYFSLSRVQAQREGLSVKFNTGFSFSKPGDDLAKVSTDGGSRFFATAELGYAFTFSKKTDFGSKLALVTSYDRVNFIAADRQTQLQMTIPGIHARLYPLHYSGKIFDGLEKIMPKKIPFILDLPVIAASYAILNSLHFDYGVGFGEILETEYAYSGFQDVTTNRTMRYFGWGFHPPIFQSKSGNWSGNAVFDFGRYSWTNGAGGTSSSKTNNLGFGVQYHF